MIYPLSNADLLASVESSTLMLLLAAWYVVCRQFTCFYSIPETNESVLEVQPPQETLIEQKSFAVTYSQVATEFLQI